jgi:predicted phage terminase large subunit-like protein
MGVDFASKGSESDAFSISIIGVHEGMVYVIDGLNTNDASLFRQFELIKSYFNKWKPIKVGVEQAAQQKMIVDQLIESTTLPIIPIKSSIVSDRMSRVQRLSVLFETGRILLNPNLTKWIDELIMFPRGAHDDTIDSLSFAVQVSQIQDEPEKRIDWKSVASNIITRGDSGVNVRRSYRVSKI